MRRYSSPEHESYHAVVRCLTVRFGARESYRRTSALLTFLGLMSASQLSPSGANYCRKQLERMLPDVAI